MSDAIKHAIRTSPVGKKLPDHLYVHRSAIGELPDVLQALVSAAEELAPIPYELVKIARDGRTVSLLSYPDFMTDPHPALAHSTLVQLDTGVVKDRDYSNYGSPPILHRKEAFLSKSHPSYGDFAALTQREEELGLLREDGTPTEAGAQLLEWIK